MSRSTNAKQPDEKISKSCSEIRPNHNPPAEEAGLQRLRFVNRATPAFLDGLVTRAQNDRANGVLE
jgi:hypothetical protein